MYKTKRWISIIIALAMVMQIFFCMPFAMAEDGVETVTVNPDGTVTVNPDADFLVAIRNSTNKYSAENSGMERDSLWADYCYYSPANQRSNTYEFSTNQAYNGSKSLLIKRPSGGYANESHFPSAGVTREKTMVASAMVLGTEANTDACISNPNSSVSMKLGYYVTTYFNTIPNGNLGESSGNKVMLKDMLEAPASSVSDAPVSKDKWKMVHAYGVFPSAAQASVMWYNSAGVFVDGSNVEVFTDDLYLGELVVAKVYNTTSETIYIPSERFKEVELTACAVNQLGNSEYFGEGSTYTWEALELPDGVTLEDNNLVISRIASPGEAKLKVTFNPTFKGANEQTAAQKEGRTAEVTLNIEIDPNVSRDPIVENVTYSGEIKDGTTLVADYYYWQVEGKDDASIITWYKRLPDETEWTSFLSGKKDTAGTYTATADDEKYYIRIGVKPYTDSDPVLSGDEIYSDEKFAAVAPVASDVTVTGLQAGDEEWVAEYTYSDINGGEKDTAKYQWYRADSIDGEYTPIDNATTDKYVVTAADTNKYIKVGVIAVSKEEPFFDEEKEAFSQPMLAAATPSVSNLSVDKVSKSMLTVTYDYSHPLNIAEGESVIEWYYAEDLITDGASFDASAYNGKTLTVKVTPCAEKKPFEGKTEVITYKVSIPTSSGGSSGGGGGGGFSPSKPIAKPDKPLELKNVPDWAKTEVDFVIANKIMEPFSEGDFGGSEFINRAEFMSVVLTAAGIEKVDYRGEFGDVISYDSFSGLLQAAVDKKIISKYDNFYPERNLTRDEMAKIVAATVKAAVGKENPLGSIEHFKDASVFQEWAVSYIKEAIGLGLMKGVSEDEFSPKGTVTRSETAVVAKRIADYVKANGGNTK